MYSSQLQAIGIDTKGKFSGKLKTLCPWCATSRKKNSEPSLFINIDEGLYKCYNCHKTGTVAHNKSYTVPKPKPVITQESKAYDWFKARGIERKTVDKFRPSVTIRKFPQGDGEWPAICHNYYLDGQLINIKFKCDKRLCEILGKEFPSEKKWFTMVKDARKIPFNMDSIKDHDYVIIVEGEEDCMVWDQVGYPSVISAPNGASGNTSWLDSVYDRLEGKKIYIATDNDDPGRGLAEELQRRFPPDRVWRIEYPGNDANETLLEYDQDAFKTLFSEARPIPIKEIVTVGDLRTEIFKYREQGFPIGDKLDMPELDRLMSWNPGELVVVTSVPGHGKSTMFSYCYCRLAQLHGWKVGIFSPEHQATLMTIRLCEQYMAKAFDSMNEKEMGVALDFVQNHFYFYAVDEITDFGMDHLLEIGEIMIRRHGVNALMFDPYTYIENRSEGDSGTERIGKLLVTLKLFGVHNKVQMTLIAHPRKMDRAGEGAQNYKRPTLYDIAGSNNFFNTCDVGIIIYREYESPLTQFVVEKMKYHFRGKRGDVYLEFDIPSGTYKEQGMPGTPIYKLLKPNTLI